MKFHRPHIKINRATIFAAGMVAGSVVVVICLGPRIVWNPKATLVADLGLLKWLAKENYTLDYETAVGIFQLVPPKQ